MIYTDICFDSRTASPGCLFVCTRGAADDGHLHAHEAYDAGCRDFCAEHVLDLPSDARITICSDTRAALAENAAKFFGHPARSLLTVGVTGTKGKTGTVCCAKAMLEEAGIKCGSIGTLGIDFGGVCVPSRNTTPDAITLHRSFAEMLKRGVRAVLIEVSSQSLKEERVHGIDFDIGVFTNFSPDHISPCEHKNVNEYKECKARLFSQCRTGFFNADDAEYGYFIKNARCRTISCGTGTECEYTAKNAAFFRLADGLFSEFDLIHGIDRTHLITPVPGMPGVYNTLLAASVCSYLGVDGGAIVRGAARARSRGRFELYKLGPSYAMIDYAHNAVSAQNLFDTVKRYGFSRIISVFGCGGERDRERRRSMGGIIAANSDICVITEDNPRNEEPGSINRDIVEGIKGAEYKAIIIEDRRKAIEFALNTAKANDIVLLIGKGHENYMEKNGRILPFCESDIIKEFKARLPDN